MSEKQGRDNRERRLQALIGLAADSPEKSGQAGACPDAETLACFVDGRLTGGKRQEVVRHLAECQHCYQLWLSAAPEAEADGAAVPGPRATAGRKRIFGYIGTALAAAASVALYLNLQQTDHKNLLMRDEVTVEKTMGSQVYDASRIGADKGSAEVPQKKSSAVEPEAMEDEDTGNFLQSPALRTVAPEKETVVTDMVREPRVQAVEEQRAASADSAPQPIPSPAPSAMLKLKQAQRSVPAKMEFSEQAGAPAENKRVESGSDNLDRFYEDLKSNCANPSDSQQTWDTLYRRGQVLLAAELEPAARKRLAGVVEVLRVIATSGGVSVGCRRLQGELAEDGKSR